MLLRCRALKQVGGFEGVADVLAEDYLLGRAVARAGYRVVTSTSPIQSVSNTSSLHAVWQRHLRWAQIRRTLGISGYLLELVLLPNIWLAALAAVSCSLTLGQSRQPRTRYCAWLCTSILDCLFV